MADSDNTTAIDNGGIEEIRTGDRTVKFRSIDDLIKAQTDQERRAGRARSFTRGKPVR